MCRAIVSSQLASGTDVTNVGFAFPLRNAGHEPLSVVWDTTFRYLGQTMVVAPAGNEHETAPHFPAALNPNPSTAAFTPTPAVSTGLYPGQSVFGNVRGVSSLADGTSGAGSAFANYGGWVNCSTIGENVLSTFMPVSGVACEDDLPTATAAGTATAFPYQRPVKSFSTRLAVWQGSSFAAPKVSAALAARLATGAMPQSAWSALTAMAQPATADPNLGFKLTTL